MKEAASKPEAVTGTPAPSQLDKFKAAARELGTDDDPERFKETVRKVGSVKPAGSTQGSAG